MPSPAERYAAALERASTPELGEFVAHYGFQLDEFQLESCRALAKGSSVLVAAPTGAGKTVVGEFAIFLALQSGQKAFYTTPIKALSNQKFHELVERYGAERVGLLTGDNSINGEAPIVVMTTEVLRNMLYVESHTLHDLGYVVMDEVHYLADRSRGAVWEEVIIHLDRSVTVVALSATVSNAEEFGAWLMTVRGETEIIVEERRPVPLWQHVMAGDQLHDLFTPDGRVNRDLLRLAREQDPVHRGRGRRRTSLIPWRSEAVELLARKDLLPAIYFLFSRAGCDEAVEQCLRAGIRLTSTSERQEIREVIGRETLGIPDDDLAALGFVDWAEGLERGIASHHAGLLPRFKEITESLFQRGLIKVVFATETLALGINMPARCVVLERLVKWNGEAHVDISPGEYTQLTGRAGRRGLDVEGHAVVLWQQAFDPEALAGLASTRTYPLKSSFRPSYDMAVNLVARLGRHTAREVLETSFAQFQADRSVVGMASEIRRLEETRDGFAESMQCHLGDFPEYAALRAELSQREKGVQQRNRSNLKAAIDQSIRNLRVGDVVEVPSGKRSGPAAVVGTGRGSDPRPLVLGADRKVRRLTHGDLARPLRMLGKVKVPKGFTSKDAQMRADLSRRMLEVARQSDATGHAPLPQAQASDEITTLRAALRQHPCHGCADREQHARWSERYFRTQRTIDQLEGSIKGRTNTVARQFDRICDVLVDLKYLAGEGDDLRVTADGLLLGRLYTESDLLLAQALRGNLLEGLSESELAAVCSALLYESRRTETDAPPSVPGGQITETLEALSSLRDHLTEVESSFRAPTGRMLDAGLVWAVYRWARGASLLQVLTANDTTAGDFVRWTRQVIDLLGQIADALGSEHPLSATARRASDLLNRGVVAYSASA